VCIDYSFTFLNRQLARIGVVSTHATTIKSLVAFGSLETIKHGVRRISRFTNTVGFVTPICFIKSATISQLQLDRTREPRSRIGETIS
jgi:hypothetical protein